MPADEARSSRSRPSRRERALTRLRRSWRRLLLASLLLAVLPLYFLPAIIAKSPLRNSLLESVNSQLEGEIEIGQLSLGWFSPVVAREVRIRDSNGDVMGKVQSVSTTASLVSLLWDRTQPGPLQVIRPQATIHVREGGSDWEDLLAPLLAESDESSQTRLQLQIEEAELELIHGPGKIVHRIAGGGDVSVDSASEKLQWRLQTELNSPGQSGQIDCDGEVVMAEPSSGTVRWKASRVGLAVVDAVLVRLGQPVRSRGQLEGQGVVEWTADGVLLTLQPTRIEQLQVAGLAALQGDVLQSQQTAIQGSCFVGAEELRCRELQCLTDFGSINASSDIRLAELSAALAASDSRRLASAVRGEVRGAIDLAALAAALPQTMHVRRDTRIQSGGVDFHVVNSLIDDGRRVEAHVRTQPIRAISGGVQVDWQDVLTLDAALRLNDAGWTLEQASCESDFLQVSGSGPPRQGQFTLRGDLDQLRRRLVQFVDLGPLQFGGQLSGKGHWRRRAETLDVGGELTAERFVLAVERMRWDAPRVTLSASAALPMDAAANGSLSGRLAAWLPQSWRAELDVAGDVLAVQPQSDGYQVVVQGDLQRWTALLEAVGGPQLDARGRIDAEANLVATANAVLVRDAQVELDRLRVRWDDREIQENKVSLLGGGVWQRRSSRWVSDRLQLQSESFAAASRNLTVGVDPQVQVDGSFSIRGDLRRLSQWLGSGDVRQPTTDLAGELVGVVEVQWRDSQADASWNLTVNDLIYRQPTSNNGAVQPVSQSRDVWREPQVVSEGGCRFQSKTGQLTLQPTTLQAAWIDVNVQGVADMAQSPAVIDLQGQLQYDWETLATRFELNEHPVAIYGRQTRPFRVRGPLGAGEVQLQSPTPLAPTRRAPGRFPDANAAGNSAGVSPDLVADASLAWERAEAYGFRVGPAEINAQLRNQRLLIQPIRTTVNGGAALLTPQLDLSSSTPTMSLTKGDGVRQVELTPEMCHGWLKYVAPSVANATAAEGELSVAIDHLRAPIATPETANVRGTLAIHEARVGPGQLTREMLSSLQQLLSIVEPSAAAELSRPSWVEIPPQDIPFHVRDQRVTHDRMLLRIRDVNITTSGSVGFDQSLDLLMEIPVRDRWVASNRYLSGLRGKSIPLRFRGSFARPNFDESALRDLGKAGVRGAAEQLLQDQLERGLKKLFQQP